MSTAMLTTADHSPRRVPAYASLRALSSVAVRIRAALRRGRAFGPALSLLLLWLAPGGAQAQAGAANASAKPAAATTAPAVANAPSAACPPLLDRTLPRLQDDVPQNLCQYRGKVVLIVNTASFCGFTPQYEGLEKLYARYAARGLVVLGFPSNDFGQQEPKGNKEIAEFCFNTYGVKFPMFSKTTVVGPNADPLYVALAKDTGAKPKWNFHKYLLDRDGKAVAQFSSLTEPLDKPLVSRIEQLLGTP